MFFDNDQKEPYNIYFDINRSLELSVTVDIIIVTDLINLMKIGHILIFFYL